MKKSAESPPKNQKVCYNPQSYIDSGWFLVCVFCKIASGEIPAGLVYKDEFVVAFRDIAPQAPVHVVVVPKEHIPCATDVADGAVWSRLLSAAVKIACELGVSEQGYRFVINTGEHGGQTVPHLHLHILAGRKLEGGESLNDNGHS